ncbi:MAG: YHS domain-containing protein [Parvularculaceae bacterium]|nr:YHS domain-containing protein [Parvularculaceae bacterium]
MKKLIAAATLGLAAATFAPTAAVAADPVHTGLFNNVAVGGYDAVSFFDGEGVEGAEEFSTTYDGAEFHFASAENLARFEEDPERFAPQYGGYCAWAISQGKLAPGRPKHANIVGGKLYLNFNGSVERRWLKDTDGFIAAADDQWPEILD